MSEEVSNENEIELSSEEKAFLLKKRQEKESSLQCAKEIAEVLKKYGMKLETTRADVIITQE